MNLYITRHGSTIWNELGITQGRSRNHLSKSGKEMANNVARELEKVKLDIIYVSPLVRTMETAKIINSRQNVKIVKDERLIEIDQGIFTGRKYATLTEKEKELKSQNSPDCNMESYESVIKRIQSFYDDIKMSKEKNVLVVTHNCCASVLEKIAKGEIIKGNNYKDFRTFSNCQVKLVRI